VQPKLRLRQHLPLQDDFLPAGLHLLGVSLRPELLSGEKFGLARHLAWI
jgi:hypothetical protein